ncbi:MAG: S8 family serine peptidase [Betaproteobacteria bacterium]
MHSVIRPIVRAAAMLGVVAVSVSFAFAQSVPDVSSLGATGANPSTLGPMGAPTGQVQIIIRLSDMPLAVAMGPNAKRNGTMWSADRQRAYLAQLKARQDAVMASVGALGGQEIARMSKAHNAVVAQIDANRVRDVAKLPGVTKVRPVVDYELSLSETVPYIGAKVLQDVGVDGTGVRVAVLDSGIDYTHYNLGGPGTLVAYTAAYGTSTSDSRNTTRDGLFPTAKVIGGYDFVGEGWPNTALAPDPDPIDFEGHGTHVADIIAGRSNDGLHKGVAPGATLYAVKVCSAVATSCSGVALLQGMDFALDPNGDDDLSDAVDVVNMSLGSAYGQREDDLSEASAIASRFGVVVVAAAGNNGDLPFVASSPASTPEVISVAQTQVPSAKAYPLIINAPASIAGTYGNTATVDWAPVVGTVTSSVSFVGRGCPAAGATPADTYLDNPAGKIALIDRGSCAISLKVDRAASAGAIGVLIGLVAAGDAVSFSYGGGTVFVPTLVIQQSLSTAIKANITAPVNATISDAAFIALAGSMATTSARGPGYSYVSIKPDIGAPGASLSAEAGTATGQTAFGGTSGATPMIAGSAALLLSANPALSPTDVKARLMNAAETNIYLNPPVLPGLLAPITRIGGGEVRVNKAYALTAAAMDAVDPASVGLSFGYSAATGTQMIYKKVLVKNSAARSRTFSITPSFRYADDAASGAVVLAAPASITVLGNGASSFVMSMKIDATKLQTWTLSGGSGGGSGPTLTVHEFDGYVTIADGVDSLHLPWHILPHKADNAKSTPTAVALGGAPTGPLTISNVGGAVNARVDAFMLTGTSARIPSADLPKPGDNFAVIDLKSVGVRAVSAGGAGDAVQFAINTFGARSHPVYPAEFDVYVDTNNDGTYDYVVWNSENGAFGSTGQTVINVTKLPSGPTVTRFFADASLNSGNMIMTALLSDMGMTVASKFRYSVYAFDNYFTGALTDAIENMVVRLDSPRFYVTGLPGAGVPPGPGVAVTVNRFAAGDPLSPSQNGLLMMYRDAKPGAEADAVTVTP